MIVNEPASFIFSIDYVSIDAAAQNCGERNLVKEMMRNTRLALLFAVFIPGLMWGCSSDETAEVPLPAPEETVPVAQDSDPNEAPEAPPKAPFPTPPAQSVIGLVPPTDPAERLKIVTQGRIDPFNIVQVSPSLKPDAKLAKKTPKKEPTTPSPPFVEPVEPTPDLARQVEISGVIEIGGIPQIILRAPNEKFTRYVQPGQYVSGGQVLVKRVENRGKTPVVVLEQVGIEVTRAVGEKVEPT